MCRSDDGSNIETTGVIRGVAHEGYYLFRLVLSDYSLHPNRYKQHQNLNHFSSAVNLENRCIIPHYTDST